MHIFQKPSAMSCTFAEWSLGLWVFSKLSGDETSCEEAPRAELTVWSPLPALGFWVQWEPSLTNSAGRGQAPSGDCGFQDTSLFPLQCPPFPLMSWCSGASGTAPPPISKDSRTFPGGLQGTCPPSSETLLSPTAQGVMLSTPSRELLVDRGDTPSLRLGVL